MQSKTINPDIPVIVISARNTLDTAVRASETGAFEYFPKPFDLDELTEAVQQALESSPRILVLHQIFMKKRCLLVGRSAPMQQVYRMIAQASQ